MRASALLFLIVWASAQPLCTIRVVAKERSASEEADNGRAAVEGILRTQQDAWNRHDLEAFMAGYWNSPELTFFSGASEHQGWQATLGRYRARYAGPGQEMGKLEFSGLRIEMLGRGAAFVRASARGTEF